MNICIYTSEQPTLSNLLNINYLINKRPLHNYNFLNVRKSVKALSLKEKLKKYYGEMRFDDGRYDYHRDSLAIEKKLMDLAPSIPFKNFTVETVEKVNDAKSESFLEKIKPDIILQAGAGILTENIFNKAAIATINVHHGIAPEIRGIDSTFWCMFYGIKEKTGVTCHIIDQNLDTGAIIQREYLTNLSGSFIDIQSANYLMGRDVLVNSIDLFGNGKFSIIPGEPVRSYYFGVVNPFLYYALKKRNFHPIMNIKDKVFKMKDVNFVKPILPFTKSII